MRDEHWLNLGHDPRNYYGPLVLRSSDSPAVVAAFYATADTGLPLHKETLRRVDTFCNELVPYSATRLAVLAEHERSEELRRQTSARLWAAFNDPLKT